MAGLGELAFDLHHASEDEIFQAFVAVSYTHLTLPTNREV